MRTSYTVALMLAILIAGTYWYTAVEAVCKLPINYAVGDIDPRFNITKDEVKSVLSTAESKWEDATGRNLFTYDETAKLKVNFVYDERQQNADAADSAKDQLDAKENVNEAIGETYNKLVEEYKKQQVAYESSKASYEQRLSTYNAEVEKYNQAGGAPPDDYARLETEQKSLEKERVSLNKKAADLNDLSEKINDIGEKGNALIKQYNDSVNRFNDVFGSGEEFTQGDYRGNSIDVYTFSDTNELTLVLMHEFGHAMSLDHVDNPKSIMYYLIGSQTAELKPTTEDLAEFQAVCGEVSSGDRLKSRLNDFTALWSSWF